MFTKATDVLANIRAKTETLIDECNSTINAQLKDGPYNFCNSQLFFDAVTKRFILAGVRDKLTINNADNYIAYRIEHYLLSHALCTKRGSTEVEEMNLATARRITKVLLQQWFEGYNF